AGISSLILLDRVMEKLVTAGLRVGNADLTVLAQRPKLAEFLPQMREKLAPRLGIPQERLNIKATTEEGLGFTGSGEGIAAHAVVLLEEN
ncbi:MAG: 2-C-methyl-D-erythritol 2,4-cyclodiphosphate synthase, partial [Pseudoflavonifractor sp.]